MVSFVMVRILMLIYHLKWESMKRLTFIILACSFSLISLSQEGIVDSQKQQSDSSSQAYTRTKAVVESGAFKFVANWGFPTGATRIDLTGNNNYITVDVEHIHAYLQYAGRVFSDNRSRGAQAGIVMEGELENWKVEYDQEKESIRYQFSHRNRPDVFDVLIRISASGGASVNILSPNREPISYEGYIEALDTSGNNSN